MKKSKEKPKLPYLRETGNALLLGLVRVHVGEYANYKRELKETLTDWAQRSKRKFDPKDRSEIGAVWSNPEHFYKTSLYRGFNDWSLIHLTMVSEQGLATRLPYIGHSIGHQLYYLNDVSVIMQRENKSDYSHLLSVLDHYRICYGFEGGDFKKSYFTATNFLDSAKPVIELTRKRPLDLRNFYNGELIGDEEDKLTTQMEAGSQTFSKKKDDFLLIAQYKINSNIITLWPSLYRMLFFLTLLDRFHEQELIIPEKDRLSYLKPFFADGFYDLVVIMRGQNLEAMKTIVNNAQFSTIGDLLDSMERLVPGSSERIRKIVRNEMAPGKGSIPKMSMDDFRRLTLCSICHEIESYPANIAEKLEKEISRAFTFEDRTCPGGLGKREHGKNGDNSAEARQFETCSETTYQSCLKEVFNRVAQNSKSILSHYGSSNYSSMLGLLSFHWGKYPSVLSLLKSWQQATGDVIKTGDLELKRAHGRYDVAMQFSATGKGETHSIGNVILMGIFLEYLLTKSCPTKDNINRFYRIEHRRIIAPVMEFKLQFFEQLDYRTDCIDSPSTHPISLHGSLGRINRLYFPYGGSICLLNHPAMVRLLASAKNRFEKSRENNSLFNGRQHEIYIPINTYSKFSGQRHNTIKKKVINAISNNIDEAVHFFMSLDHPNQPFQSAFNRFLKKRYKDMVTPETLELIFTTLCSFDSYLANPITFYFFLDLRQHVVQFLEALTSLHMLQTDDEYFLFYWNRKTYCIELINPIRFSNLKGVEGWLIQKITFIESIINQRIIGIYPQHDRNFLRLSDIRIFNSKKVSAASWMVHSICGDLVNSLPKILLHSAKEVRDRNISTLQGYKDFENKVLESNNLPQRFIPRFCNTPEILLNEDQQIIEINARYLTTIEGIGLLMHELGHMIADKIYKQYKRPSESLFNERIQEDPEDPLITQKNGSFYRLYNWQDPEKSGIYLKPGDLVEKVKSLIEEEFRIRIGDTPDKAAKEGDLSDKIKLFIKEEFAEQIDDFPEKTSKEIVDTYFDPYDQVSGSNNWEEIFSDLLHFKLSIGQFGRLYEEENIYNPRKEQIYEFKEKRKKTTRTNPPSGEPFFTIADDFLLSLILQFLRFPTIIRKTSFKNLLVRLTFQYGLIKYHDCPDYAKLSVHEAATALWDEQVFPFLTGHLVNLLDRLQDQNRKMGRRIKNKNNKVDKSEVIFGFRLEYWKDIRKALTSIRHDQKWKRPIDKELYIFLRYQLKPIFIIYFHRYFQGLKEYDPFFLYLQYLADVGQPPTQNLMPGEEPLFFEDSNYLLLIRQGILPKKWKKKGFKKHFYAALQTGGIINLLFALTEKPDYLEMDGYLGYHKHAYQQHLSRTRRIMSGLLWEGAMWKVKKELKRLGRYNNRTLAILNKKLHLTENDEDNMNDKNSGEFPTDDDYEIRTLKN